MSAESDDIEMLIEMGRRCAAAAPELAQAREQLEELLRTQSERSGG